MAFIVGQPHFVLFPFMAQGHTIPMIDIARLLAKRGVIITVLTTPLNAKRFASLVTRAVKSGLQIRVVHLHFPSIEAGLPEGCENFDMLPSLESGIKFFTATSMLREQVEELLRQMSPRPSCLISDMCFPWTTKLANKLEIPRIVFHGMCCFSLLCLRVLEESNFLDGVALDSEYFEVPNFRGQIELTKAQVNGIINPGVPEWKALRVETREAEVDAYGIIVNSFDELEQDYIEDYMKAKGIKVWCIGPVSLCNKDELDKAERGNKASIDEHHCLKWLASREPSSILYVCLGSLTRLSTSQMIELGLALESSNMPFIWVLREISDEFKNWLIEENFEERIKENGLLIRGWAPQVLILSHPSIGGFLTHCGWNSSLEGISAGVPMLTWPTFAEQFVNEKLLVNILGIGVRIGVEKTVVFGEEEKVGVQVDRDDIGVAIERLMGDGEESEMRRIRAKELGEKAKKAVEKEGSSHRSMTRLIQDLTEQTIYL